VDRLWLDRLAEQAAWEGVTDPERLALAFGALEEAGITARENFTCCRAAACRRQGPNGRARAASSSSTSRSRTALPRGAD
jgi:hypothetical protein